MQNTNETPVEREARHIVRDFRRFGRALVADVKKSWKEDLEPNLVKLDQTAENVTERTYRVAKDTLREVFRRHHHVH
jgi:hypothetical protein